MCTSLKYVNGDCYFGRNLDLEYSFGEKVVITPRGYGFKLRKEEVLNTKYAMIGMATVAGKYPLYAEAVNEKGLYIAGLNFPGNAVYNDETDGKLNITPFEFIPWLLGNFATVDEAEESIKNINLININFAENMPLAPLHWMISDRERCIVVEQRKDGLNIFENEYNVLTNNPPFEYHRWNMNNYINLTNTTPENRFSQKLDLSTYSRGMGSIGLPGDVSSASRFVRAVYNLSNSESTKSERSSVSQVFHVLDSVAMIRGAALTPEGKSDMTRYSCCINADKGIYYYKTYENCRITAIDMTGENIDGDSLTVFELERDLQIKYSNSKESI